MVSEIFLPTLKSVALKKKTNPLYDKKQSLLRNGLKDSVVQATHLGTAPTVVSTCSYFNHHYCETFS
jgi:hypothetical protein